MVELGYQAVGVKEHVHHAFALLQGEGHDLLLDRRVHICKHGVTHAVLEVKSGTFAGVGRRDSDAGRRTQDLKHDGPCIQRLDWVSRVVMLWELNRDLLDKMFGAGIRIVSVVLV